jgi:hypothetical protein
MTESKRTRKKILITKGQRAFSHVCLGLSLLLLALLVLTMFDVFGYEPQKIYAIFLYSSFIIFFLIWTPILVPNFQSLVIIAEFGLAIVLLLQLA